MCIVKKLYGCYVHGTVTSCRSIGGDPDLCIHQGSNLRFRSAIHDWEYISQPANSLSPKMGDRHVSQTGILVAEIFCAVYVIIIVIIIIKTDIINNSIDFNGIIISTIHKPFIY